MSAEGVRIRAFTTRNPWAGLLARGRMRYRTHKDRTHYRGPVAIHAARTRTDLSRRDREFFLLLAKAFDLVDVQTLLAQLNRLPHGAIVGLAEVVDCFEITEKTWLSLTREQLVFANWTPGRWAWVIENARPLEQPIPSRGYQGLFNVTVPEELMQ